MAQKPLYTLVENEKVIFELNIDDATRSDDTAAAVAGLFKTVIGLIPVIGPMVANKKKIGVFVVTNMRCLVAVQGKACCQEERAFWSFPRKALNGCSGYDKSKTCCCSSFTISIGITVGTTNTQLEIETSDIKNDEQAQALVAKIAELAQQAE